jgi:uncharacterized protein (UPF0332 family)
MKEIESLIARSKKYLESAEILLRSGDYEYTFVISEDEAKEMSDEGRDFVKRMAGYLEKKGALEK